MNLIKFLLLISIMGGCLDPNTNDQDTGHQNLCGPMPKAPYWEYTETAGAPAQAMVPLHLWLQDLQWRKDVVTWAECVSPGSTN